MTLNSFEDISRPSLLSVEHLTHSAVFSQYLGEEAVRGLIRDGVLRQVEWSQLEGACLRLPFNGVEKNYWISVRDDKVIFEPEDGLTEALEKPLSYDKFVSMDKGAFAKKLFLENGFTFDSSEVADGNIFWGSRTISGKKIIWCVSFSLNSLLMPIIRDAVQRTSAKACLLTSPFFKVSPVEPVVVLVPLPEIRVSWIVSPSLYLKSKFHFKSQDYLGVVTNQPLLVDRVEKIIYVFGVRINDKTDDRIYKFIDSLASNALFSEVTHDHFAYNFLNISKNQSSQGYIGDLRSKIKKKIEDKISDVEKQKMALLSLYEQPRDGAVRCNFSQDQIHFWDHC